jgi:enediyne biosynthesis protein E4
LNDGKGSYKDVTNNLAPQLEKIGMITDSKWIDVNQDGDLDLVIVGDWMPITVFLREDEKFINRTKELGLENTNGWYHVIETADFNNDNRMDLVVGNHGLNSRFRTSDKEPVTMHINDFDHNGTIEQIISRYDEGKSYPLVLRNDLLNQIPSLKKKYLHYSDYKNKSITEIFDQNELKNSLVLGAYFFETSVFLNKGNGFVKMELPIQAQFSPVYSILSGDFNKDGNVDLFLGGNLYRAKPETGIYDASYGLLIVGDGKGNFKYIPPSQSGISIKGEIRAIREITFGGKKLILVGKNNDLIETIRINK